MSEIVGPPPGYVTPSFPSLYDPRLEWNNRPGTYKLYNSIDIFRFTLYWTLLLYASTYTLCGTAALLIHVISRWKRPGISLLVPVAFAFIGTFFSVILSAVIGYVLAAMYSVGKFTVSTWVPLLWAIIQTLVAIMGSYSAAITIL